MRRARTWPWRRMRPFLARFSGSVGSVHTPSWVDFITIMPVFKFSVHTAMLPAGSFEYTREFRSTLLFPQGRAEHPDKSPRLPMPVGYRRDRHKALELSFGFP